MPLFQYSPAICASCLGKRNVPLGSLIKRLRSAVGQESAGAQPDESAEAIPRPAWADAAAVKQEFDAREMIESGGHPMPRVMSDLSGLGRTRLTSL